MISVIIPTYRPCMEMLGECIKSLDNQTLTKDLFEVIVIKNGMADGDEVLNSLSDIFPTLNIQVLKTMQTGVSNARNMGIEVSSGKYLCFIDDDDWVSSNYLKELYNGIEEDTITTANVVSREGTFCPDLQDYLGDTYLTFVRKKDPTIWEGRRFLNSACCKLIPRQVIGGYRFNTHFSMGEDALFMATISKNIKRIHPAKENPTYYRRINRNSASRSHKSIGKKLKNLYNLWGAYLKVYFSAPLHYSFPLFCNRMLAVTKWLFR